jgi:DNA-directed RNA polymerase subunit F
MKNKGNSYLDMVGFSTPEEAYKKIKEWVSGLSDQDHFIRSTIFDIHAGIELELRRIFYHHNKSLLFLTGNEEDDSVVLKDFEKMIDDLNFATVFRILKPILIHWYIDLKNIEEINNLRNQVAHRADIKNISYKGRNPFSDADAFAQVFFEAWAVKECLKKFFFKAIDEPKENCREYYKAYKKYVLTNETKK